MKTETMKTVVAMPMAMAPGLVEEARREFAMNLRYSDVMRLGARMGFSRGTMRALVEGTGAVIERKVFVGTVRGYYERERVLEVLSSGAGSGNR